MKNFILMGMLAMVLGMPQVGVAQTGEPVKAPAETGAKLDASTGKADVGGGNPPGQDVGGGNPPGQDTGGGNPGILYHPLGKDVSILQFLQNVLDFVNVFVVPIIVFFIIYGGFLLVIAGGDPTKLTKGKSTITWALIGGVIMLAANIILDVLQATLDSLTS